MLALTVERYDSPGRFLVGSHSRDGESHLVDLLGHDGFGECACEHFGFSLGPQLRDGETPALPCAHIIRAKIYLAEEVVRIMLDAALTDSQNSG